MPPEETEPDASKTVTPAPVAPPRPKPQPQRPQPSKPDPSQHPPEVRVGAAAINWQQLAQQMVQLAQQVGKQAVTVLGQSITLSPQEQALIASAAANAAMLAAMAINAPADQQAQLQWQMKTELQALANIETAKGVAVTAAVNTVLQQMLPQLILKGIITVIGIATGPIGSGISMVISTAV